MRHHVARCLLVIQALWRTIGGPFQRRRVCNRQMQQIELDATTWKSENDFYDALLPALVRLIGTGETSMLFGTRSLQETLTRWSRPLQLRCVDGPRANRAELVLKRFIDLIRETGAEGVPVTIQASVSN